jgi:hypothetical protein
LGNSHDFGERLQKIISSYGRPDHRPVFITDGAAWIKEWIADSYHLSCPVLDFYHAMEHLYEFADKAPVHDAAERKQRCERQKELLPDSKAESVPDSISLTAAREEDKKNLIRYCGNNKKRMRYRHCRKAGCGITGSGAIESAHRTVIQKRMKLSGQRWSRRGAENMLRLRVLSMNKQWSKVIDLLKMPVRRAA